ncbi:MAG: hypothetical protein WCG83_07265 [Candidatus Peregrinibacteria bacterium]
MKKIDASSCSVSCSVTKWMVSLLLFLATMAAAVGTYNAHFGAGEPVYGSTSDSLAIIAFVISLMLFRKSLCHCCGSCAVKK